MRGRGLGVLGGLLLTLVGPQGPAVAAGRNTMLHGPAPGHVLWMRASPSAESHKVGVIPSGTRVVDNLGCRDAGRQRWCRIRFHGTTGWIPARYVGKARARLADRAGRTDAASG